MKRTVWILLAAIAVVAGVYIAADLLGNGMLREFLSEQFFYMEEYTDTTGILHQYLSPNWYRIKQLLFLLTALVVVICIVCVRTQSSRVAMKHRAEIEKAMETALHQPTAQAARSDTFMWKILWTGIAAVATRDAWSSWHLPMEW